MRPTENEVFNTPIEDTFGSWEQDADPMYKYTERVNQHTGEVTQEPVELDDELGLAVVAKKTIFEVYGVHCDPSKNNFHASLHDQFERNGRLSEKQINALKNPR